ncbi:hypothetical protein [Archangium lipolyticum]|uniref:hypothetical protein n=1 Tax=Archangium lipolyticum TaxID=2970465 RepID=UPI00214A6343|nr:hypothetical protein [Archangium lipolyticum]
MIPDGLMLHASLERERMADVVETCLAAIADAGAGPIVAWASPQSAARQTMEEWPAALTRMRSQQPQSVRVVLSGEKREAMIYNNESPWGVKIDFNVGSSRASEFGGRLAALADIAHQLLRRGGIKTLSVRRQGGGAECLPEVPIAKTDRHVVVTTEREVAAEYEDPQAFWAAWDRREQVGEQVLLFRAMNASDNVSYLRAVLEHQATMARAARPQRTRYFSPRIRPEERPLYSAGEPRLLPVGYEATSRTVEYSCLVEPDEHIHLWEINALSDQIQDKKLADGRQIDTVRVVFFDKQMAMREKRPLLDVGARVFFQKDATQTEEVLE